MESMLYGWVTERGKDCKAGNAFTLEEGKVERAFNKPLRAIVRTLQTVPGERVPNSTSFILSRRTGKGNLYLKTREHGKKRRRVKPIRE